MSYNQFGSNLKKSIALAAIVAPLWTGTALAWTGEEVVQRLQEVLKQQKIDLTFSTADVDGRTVILRDAKADIFLEANTDQDANADKESSAINLGEITLDGITETADGAYIIDKLALADTKIIEKDTILTTKGIRIEKLRLPEKSDSSFLSKMNSLKAFHLAELSFSNKTENLVDLQDFYVTFEPFSEETAGTFSYGFKSLDMNILAIELLSQKKTAESAAEPSENPAKDKNDQQVSATSDEDTLEAIRALGVEKIHLSMASTGSWSPYSGEYIIDNLTINGREIGDFQYKLHMGGYDMKFIQAVQDLYNSVLNEEADNTAMQMAALGMLQNLSIKNMEMRYDNAAYVNKLIEYEAKKQSLSRETYIKGLKDQLQAGIIYFENEPRVVSAVEALSEFLDNPQSISLKIQPENPANFGILTAVGMANSKKLWSVLGVTVEANK